VRRRGGGRGRVEFRVWMFAFEARGWLDLVGRSGTLGWIWTSGAWIWGILGG
jgi:hypothetical protein